MKKLLAVTLAAALAAGFAGCGGSGNSSGTTGNAASTASGSADAGETIKVGSLAPLTGSGYMAFQPPTALKWQSTRSTPTAALWAARLNF